MCGIFGFTKFKKEDLENYLIAESENDEVNNYEEFEDQITSNWKK